MKLKAKEKTRKMNKKLFSHLEKLEGRISAGYPSSLSSSHAPDLNGNSALYKATQINYTNDNFNPFLKNALEKNEYKYKKQFIKIVKFTDPQKISKALDRIGEQMVEDIKAELSDIQQSPLSTSTGCLYGAVKFIKGD